jgi:hypothetical protein
MPDSYGKRQRQGVKARKANAREERRLARQQRRADREAGIEPLEPGQRRHDDEEGSLEERSDTGASSEERSETVPSPEEPKPEA